MSTPITLLWLRRDLRLADHPALVAASERARDLRGALLPIFIWEPSLIAGRRASANRTWYLRESLAELSRELTSRGSTLLELEGPATSTLPALIRALRSVAQPSGEIALFATRDHTPYARVRDRAIADVLLPLGVTLHAVRGLTVVEPDELLTASDTAYGVYTPYFRRWLERVTVSAGKPLAAPTKLPAPPALVLPDALRPNAVALAQASRPTARLELLPLAGEGAARTMADRWITAARGAGANGYAARRNTLADEHGTSRLSAALHFGLISPRELVARLLPLPPEREGERSGERLWVSQIAWRDFYTQVLWHAPHAARSAWKPAYDAIEWNQQDEPFNAWREGRTGYPIVDAAMRQLHESGFMHNRARMITASFLTKDLLVDWRKGEEHFLQHLVDGDIAANNGGWQWSAGSGTDAQPYFRIFNPVTQAGNFDPDGAYVRRWIPELAALKAPAIHAPWAHPTGLASSGITLGVHYPYPIVDHAEARVRTLEAYARAIKGIPAPDGE
jgi:deoxyribodipyrimidine photo-lyase